jgi:uncharacterized protein (DUF433 family)
LIGDEEVLKTNEERVAHYCRFGLASMGHEARALYFCLPTQGFLPKVKLMDYSGIITVEPGKRGGKPCIRGLRITVYDVLENLASGMTHEQLLQEFPYLTEEDIRACLAFAADRERKLETITE